MRIAYVDSSAIVALEFGEVAAGDVAALLDSFDRLVASNLLEAEVTAACAREGITAPPPSLSELAWLLPDRPLSAELRRVFDAGALKGADAWHLACALLLDPSASELVVVTLDQRQARAARRLGFDVRPQRGGKPRD